MEERGHILKVLKDVQKALRKKDNIEIKTLSNKVIHHASIHQDPDIISIAVIIYALSKLIEREDYKKYKSWPNFYQKYVQGIDNAIKALNKNDLATFRKEIDLVRRLIAKLSGKLKIYMGDVFKKAQINKASRIYEHGISMEKTAKILGVSVWELAEYAGKTGIADVNLTVTMPIRQRIKLVDEIFK
jgi:esterase/lipase